MEEAARTGRTRHPLLMAIAEAQAINQRAGGILVVPWELDQLPEEWRDAYQALSELPVKQKEKRRLEKYFEAFRQKHPTFGKY